MTKKVYVIIHDGSKVLVGEGGRSGGSRTLRKGYHLPGGKIESGETVRTAAIRETSEETGITILDSQIVADNVTSTKAATATFVVVKVASVDTLVSSFKRPVVKNIYDEPFTGVFGLASKDCWKNVNFSDAYWTDWFGFGLEAAKSYIDP